MCQKFGLFYATLNFFDFFHDDNGQHCAIFGLGIRFQKKNPGISRGLSLKKLGFWHFLGNAIMKFFDFLHDERDQYCATFGLGVRFQKKYLGISRGLSAQKLDFLTFSWKRYYNFFWFFAWWYRPTLCNIWPRCQVSKR